MWGVISVVFGLVELAIGLRFLFLLLGVDAVGFVAWIFNVTYPLVVPFGTVFGHTFKAVPGAISGSSFDMPTLVALLVYGLIGGIVLRIIARPSSR
jgi:hypothetical protein